MSIQAFAKGLEDLTNSIPAQTFRNYSGQWLTILKGPHVIDKETVQQAYERIHAAYQKTMASTDILKRDIDTQRTRFNEREMDPIVYGVTEFQDEIEKTMRVFTDRVLDRCPTSKIDYGMSCIGPQIKPADSQMFEGESQTAELQKFSREYPYIREIRGDGNCFVSAFITRYLEHLRKEGKIEEFIQLIRRGDDGFLEEIDEEDREEIMETLREFSSGKDEILEDNHKILPLIKYFRLLAADEMIKNRKKYENTFKWHLKDDLQLPVGEKSYDTLVSECVAGMGINFVDESIAALCKRLDFPVKIKHYARPDEFNVLDGVKPMATFCRKGAHYFVLYEQEGISTGIPYHRTAPLGETVFVFGKEHNSSTFKLIKCNFQLIECKDESGWMREHRFPQNNANVRAFYTDRLLSDVDYKPLASEAPFDVERYKLLLPKSVSTLEYESFIDRDCPKRDLRSDDIAEEGEGKEEPKTGSYGGHTLASATRYNYALQPTLTGHPFPWQTPTVRHDYPFQPTPILSNIDYKPLASEAPFDVERYKSLLPKSVSTLEYESFIDRDWPQPDLRSDDIAEEGEGKEEPKTVSYGGHQTMAATTVPTGYYPSQAPMTGSAYHLQPTLAGYSHPPQTLLTRHTSVARAPLDNSGQNENTMTKKKGKEQSEKERFLRLKESFDWLDGNENPLRAQQDPDVDYT